MGSKRRRPLVPPEYVQAVRRAVAQLLDRAGITTPPVEVNRLALCQDVIEIRESHLGTTDAHLTPSETGFVVEVSAFASPQRKRFSIAHEIAHTFFNPVTRTYRRSGLAVTVARERPEIVIEESLCDIAAAEMLMPEHLFREAAMRERPSIAAVQGLASLFDTSLEATALRYAVLSPEPVQVTAWKRSYSRLLPKWNRGSDVLTVSPFQFRHADSFVQWHITKAYLTNELISAHDVETSCYPPQRIWIQAQGFRHGSSRYVLSLMRSAYSKGSES